MVQFDQLHSHYRVPLSHGWDDPPALTTQGHCKIQPSRDVGKCCSHLSNIAKYLIKSLAVKFIQVLVEVYGWLHCEPKTAVVNV